MTKEELITRIYTTDSEKLKSIIRKNSKEDVEEVFQSAVEKILSANIDFEDNQRVWNFVWSVFYNQTIDEFRKNKFRKWNNFELKEEYFFSVNDYLKIIEEEEEKYLLKRIFSIVENQTQIKRTVLSYRLKGYTFKEISKKINKSEGHLKKTYHQIINNIRKELRVKVKGRSVRWSNRFESSIEK